MMSQSWAAGGADISEGIPPVDDIERGVLDRGYRVAGEKQTMDARELDDLKRGQLEEGVASSAC